MADVTVETIVDEDAAVAKVTVKIGTLTTGVYTGSSKRHPTDYMNSNIGESLAIARALEKAVKDLNRVAERELGFDQAMAYLGAYFKEPSAVSE